MATFRGKRLIIDIYGQSHDEAMGARVRGLPSFTIDRAALAALMARRKASGQVYATARSEADEPIFHGLDGACTTDDFAIEIRNANVRGHDYADLYGKPRPAHADYAWHVKDGALDFAGGGRFSARLTAPLTAVGGLCLQYLREKRVYVQAYIAAIGTKKGASYQDESFDYAALDALPTAAFPALSGAEDMLSEIAAAKADRDSVGGKIECVVRGFPAGIGDNLFEGLEGKLAMLLYAVPAVKAVEFGSGTLLAAMRGSAANDSLYYNDAGQVRFASNHAGGVNGGISNGNAITMGVTFRPTPSIAKEQRTVDLVHHTDTTIAIHGRHDACVVPRAVPVVEAVVGIALLDELLDSQV